MKTLTALRSVDVCDMHLGNSSARLKYLGYQLQEELFLPAKNYLRFHAQFEDQSEIKGFIDVATWLTQSIPSIDGIDWFSLDEQVLYSLISAYPLKLELVNQHSPIVKSAIVELASDVSELVAYPRLATSTGIVLVEQFTYGDSIGSSDTAVGQELENKIVTNLNFILGYSNLPVSSLATIEVGDALLIEHVAEHITSNNKILFKYILTQESIMVDEQVANDEQSDQKVENPNVTEEDKLNSLPIELSFVLMEKTVTLAELKAMAPGEVIELPQNQVMNVEIRANQRSFCRGELVQLSNGQLAVEIRQIWE